MFFLVLVYVFNIDLSEFSAVILEKGLLPRKTDEVQTQDLQKESFFNHANILILSNGLKECESWVSKQKIQNDILSLPE